MIWKQCKFCAWCLRNYPDEIALTIYPVAMKACPRCTEVESREIETDAIAMYHGAPVNVKPVKKPQKMMF